MDEVLALKMELNLERQRLLQAQIMLLQRDYQELQRIKEGENEVMAPNKKQTANRTENVQGDQQA